MTGERGNVLARRLSLTGGVRDNTAAFAKLAHWRGNETVPIEPDVWIGTLGQVQFSRTAPSGRA
jgi:hypothetical protein